MFADYVAIKMTESPVTYATFWVIVLHQEPSFTSTYRLVREFSLHTRVGSRIASTFMVLTVVFVLVFPTFVNSMTGYITDNGPFIKMPDGNMVEFNKLKRVAYVINDDRRINLTDDYNVTHSTSSMI